MSLSIPYTERDIMTYDLQIHSKYEHVILHLAANNNCGKNCETLYRLWLIWLIDNKKVRYYHRPVEVSWCHVKNHWVDNDSIPQLHRIYRL